MAKYIVTGGGGFVGKALVCALRTDGHQVISISRGDYPQLREQGAQTIRADLSQSLLRNYRELEGAQAVFHTAAKVDMWGPFRDFFHTNVLGTRNVIQLCRDLHIPRLVYTSSPSVIADGTHLRGIDESYPHPKRFKAFYPATKAAAEQEVLQANCPTLFTCALRPHLIFGPGDTNLIPTLLERARAGRLVQVGAGKNMVDFSFIDDCVQAHLDAERALELTAASRGRVYFISQGDPFPLWNFVAEILKRSDLPLPKRKVPASLAYGLAAILEAFARLRGADHEPLLTRFLVSEMATDHYFSIDRARKLLGYKPRYSVLEGLDRTFAEPVTEERLARVAMR